MPISDSRKGRIYKQGIGTVAHPVISEHFSKIEIITGHSGSHLSAQHSGSQNKRVTKLRPA